MANDALKRLAANYRSRNTQATTKKEDEEETISTNSGTALQRLAENYRATNATSGSALARLASSVGTTPQSKQNSSQIQNWFDNLYETMGTDGMSNYSNWQESGSASLEKLKTLQGAGKAIGDMIAYDDNSGFSMDDFNKYYAQLNSVINSYGKADEYYAQVSDSLSSGTGTLNPVGDFSYNDQTTTYGNIGEIAAALGTDTETLINDYLYNGAGNADYSGEDEETQKLRALLSTQIDYYTSQLYGLVGSYDGGKFTYKTASEIALSLEQLQAKYASSKSESEKAQLEYSISWMRNFLANSANYDDKMKSQILTSDDDYGAAQVANEEAGRIAGDENYENQVSNNPYSVEATLENLDDSDKSGWQKFLDTLKFGIMGGSSSSSSGVYVPTFNEDAYEYSRVAGSLDASSTLLSNERYLAEAQQNLDALDPVVRQNVEAAADGDDTAQSYIDQYFGDDVSRGEEYKDYVDALNNKEKADQQREDYAEWSTANTFNSIVASAGRVAAGFLTPLGNVETILSKGYASDDRPIDINSDWFWADRYRESVTEAITNEIGSEWGKIAYNMGMSIADSAALAGLVYVTGGAFGLSGAALNSFTSTTSSIIMGSQIASNAVYEGIQKGYSNDKAIAMGAIYAGIEIMTEKIGLDAVLGSFGKATGKNWVVRTAKNIWNAGLPEGTEEVVSDILGGIVDTLANTDQSELNQIINSNIESGMTQEDAVFQALLSIGGETILDFAGGFMGGALISNITTGIEGFKHNNTGKNIKAVDLQNNTDVLQAYINHAQAYNMAGMPQGVSSNLSNAQAGYLVSEVQKSISGSIKDAATIEELDGAIYQAATLGDENYYQIASYQYYAAATELTGKVQPIPEAVTMAYANARAAAVKPEVTKSKTAAQTAEAPAKIAQTTQTENTEESGPVVNVQSIESVEDGSVIVKTDSGLADATEVNTGVNVSTLELAYNYGKANIPISKVAEISGAAVNDVIQMAYDKGLSDRTAGFDSAQAELSNKIGRSVGVLRSINEEELSTHGVSAFTFSSDIKQKNAQRKAITVLRSFAEDTGINVVLYSSKSSTGSQDARQGWYDPKTSAIYLDIFAGYNGETAILRTFSHELTHFIQDWSPKQYEALQNFLIDFYHKGETMQSLIEKEIGKAEDNGQTMTEAEAMDEVTANACEMMLFDGKAVEKLATEHKGIFKKIHSWLKGMVRAIKQVFKELSAYEDAAKLLQSSVDKFEAAQDMWTDALASSVETFKGSSENADIAEETEQTSSEVKNSLRGASAVGFTESRIDYLLSYYGASNPKYSKAYAAYISPLDFLSLTTTNVNNIKRQSRVLDEEELKGERQEIYLQYDPETGEVTGHEGRHRMYALMEAGYDRVAIALVPEGEAGRYSRTAIPALPLTGQEFANGTAPGSVTINNLIPISRGYEQELRDTFGNKISGLRYQLRDSEYLELAKDPEKNKAELQSAVDEIATKNGYERKVYHGSHERFTVFSHIKSGGLFNFVDNQSNASTYAFGGGGHRSRKNMVLVSSTGVVWKYDEKSNKFFVIGSEMADPNTDAYVGVDRSKYPANFVSDYGYEFKKEYAGEEIEDIEREDIDTWYDEFRYIPENANVGEFYIKAQNVLDLTDETKNSEQKKLFRDIYDFAAERGASIQDQNTLANIYRSASQDFVMFWNYTKHEALGRTFENYIVPYLKKKGFDSIKHYDDSHKTYVVFDPEQIKSSAPVTYSDSGSIIPLSQRFDSGNQDVRYQLRDPDAKTKAEISALDKQENDISAEIAEMEQTSLEIPPENKTYRDLLDTLRDKFSSYNTKNITESVINGAAKRLREKMNTNLSVKDISDLLNFFVSFENSGKYDLDSAMKVALKTGEMMVDSAKSAPDARYAALNQYLQQTPFYLDSETLNDVAYAYDGISNFYKAAFGKMRVVKQENANSSLDGLWTEMSGMFPEFFNEDTKASEQPGILLSVLENKSTPTYDGISRDSMVYIAGLEVLAEVYNLPIQSKITSVKIEAKQQYADQIKAAKAGAKAAYKNGVLAGAMSQGARDAATKRRMTEDYETRLEAKREELRKVRERREEKISQLKDYHKQYVESRNESDSSAYYKRRITSKAASLTKWLVQPNNLQHVPEQLRKPLSEFLSAIDFTSARGLTGGNATKADMRFMKSLKAIKTTLAELTKNGEEGGTDLYLPDEFSFDLAQFEDAVSESKSEYVINGMTATELKELSRLLSILQKSITNINKLFANKVYQNADQAGNDTIEDLDKMSKANKFVGGLTDWFAWKNILPIYGFDRLGRGGKAIFDGIRRGLSQYSMNAKEIVDFTAEAYETEEVKKWSKEIREVEIDGNSVKMTTSQIMSLYCLAKREAAVGHLLGEGIRVGDIKSKTTTIKDSGHVLTPEEIQNITGTLTERQKEVANLLQRYMSTKGSEWGNAVSMARWGYRAFGEQFYFPIESDTRHLTSKAAESRPNNLYRLLNSSFTKPLTERANNRIVVSDIFDVFSQHMSDMAQYNALALPVLDALKWRNYKSSYREASGAKRTISVYDVMNNAYGDGAMKFVTEILKSVNGAQVGGDEPAFASKMVMNSKRAMVAANVMTALKQPLSIIRAKNTLPSGSIVKGMANAAIHMSKSIAEMKEYSGIATWKEMGFYEVSVSRSINSLIKHNQSFSDKASDATLKPAKTMDRITWAAIWESSKVAAEKSGSENLMEKTAEIFENTIYRTQVVDSVLTKAETMRSKNIFMKMATAFLSEPLTSYSVLLNSYQEYNDDIRGGTARSESWKKHGKKIGVAVSLYVMAQVAESIITALMNAFRDDDDYETFMQKASDGFFDNLIDNLLPFNSIPIVRDIWSYAKGFFGLESYDTDGYLKAFEYIRDGITMLENKLSDDPTTSATWWGIVYKNLQGISMATGFPASNAMREVIAIWNNTVAQFVPRFKVKLYEDSTKAGTSALYAAIRDNDVERSAQIYAELLANGATEDEIASGIISSVKEDYLSGGLTYDEAEKLLIEYHAKKEYDEDSVYWDIKKWESADDEYTKYSELYAAVKGGDSAAYKKAYAEHLEHGDDEKTIKSQLTSLIGDDYKDGIITEDQAADMLTEYTGRTNDEAYWLMQSWDAKAEGNEEYGKYDEIYDAVVSGNETTYERLLSNYEAHGVDEDTVKSQVTSMMHEEYTAGRITASKVATVMKEYKGYDDNDVYWLLREWDRKDAGDKEYSQYGDFHTAVQTGTNIKAVIAEYTSHGVETKTLASNITSYFKPLYLKMTNAERASLKGYLLNAYSLLGYNRDMKSKDIDAWLKQ